MLLKNCFFCFLCFFENIVWDIVAELISVGIFVWFASVCFDLLKIAPKIFWDFEITATFEEKDFEITATFKKKDFEITAMVSL